MYLLKGSNVFKEFAHEEITPNEIVSECDGLLRLILMKDIRHTRRLLFWKKSFQKLRSLCEAAGMEYAPDGEGAGAEAACTERNDVRLFFSRGDLNRDFLSFLRIHRQLNHDIASSEPGRHSPCSLSWDDDPGDDPPPVCPGEHFENPRLLARLREIVGVTCDCLPSSLVGIAPERDYFPLDADVSLLRIEGVDYDRFLNLKKTIQAWPTPLRNFLLHTQGILFVVRKLPTYVDLVPLSPLTYANVYSLVHAQGTGFRIPASIRMEQEAKAKNLLASHAAGYRRNNGWIEKLPFPCLYMEDDLAIFREALHRMRLFLLHQEGLCFITSRDLLKHVGDMHPRCRDFLKQLRAYYEQLRGRVPAQPAANNLYRCLHQFMDRLLSGEKDITVDEPARHLGISVGIITRNRASDLREAMASLTRQVRPADEIIVVDNGSSDDTRDVVEGFSERLPIRYLYLDEASIPAARNMVIAHARFDIVAFTDDDCIAEPGWMEAVERGFLRAENIGIVGGWVRHAGASPASVLDRYYRVFHHNTT